MDSQSGTLKRDQTSLYIARITAMWGFSEAALGGILHAFSVPFTGIVIGGAAAIFIALIGYFTESRSDVIRATIIVIFVKFAASPHTPFTAYFSVALQGIFGQLFFNLLGFRAAAFLLGTVTLSIFGFQKVITLTIIFGMGLWDSINAFGNFVAQEFFGNSGKAYDLSYWLIGVYAGLHFLGGLFFGTVAAKVPYWVKSVDLGSLSQHSADRTDYLPEQRGVKKKKKRKWIKITVFVIFAAVISLPYLEPSLEENVYMKVITMFARAVLFIFLWFTVLSPLVNYLLKKALRKHKSKYAGEVKDIISLFPKMREVVNFSIARAKKKKGVRKIKTVLSYSIAVFLFRGGLQDER